MQVLGYVTFTEKHKRARFAAFSIVKNSPDDDAGPQVKVLVDNLKQL